MVLENLRAKLSVDASPFEDGLRDAERSLDGLQDRASDVGRSMQRTGRRMSLGVTAPLTAMGGLAAREAANFDQAMTESMAVMGDVSDAMEDDLMETAREVGRQTTLSAEEAAESYFFLASAGLEAEESMAAMPEVAALAEAGHLDMADAADVATNVMGAYGKEAEDLNEITDILVATNTRHNQSVEDMADAFSMVAPTAAGMGIEMDELAASVGMLGDVGIDGQRAGTALNTIISQMADETGPAATAMEEMGVSVRDAEGEMRPLTDIIRDFEEAGADAGDMAEIFGTRGGPAMAALLEQGSDALAENSDELTEMEGVTEDLADAQRDTLNAQLRILRGTIEDVAIGFGQELVPVISRVVTVIDGLATRFQNLSSRQRRIITVVAGLAAAIGPLLLAFGTLLTLVPTIVAGATAIGAAITLMTGPVGIAVLAIGALAAAFAADFMGIRSLVERVVGRIIDFLWPLISILKDEFIETLEVWRDTGERILAFYADLWEEHGETVMAIVRPFLRGLRALFDASLAQIEFIVRSVIDAIVTIISVGLALMRGDFEGAFELIAGFLERQGERFEDFGEALIDALTDGILAVASKPVDAVKGIASGMRDHLPGSDAKVGPLSDLTDAGHAVGETLADGIEETAPDIDATMERHVEIDDFDDMVAETQRDDLATDVDFGESMPSTAGAQPRLSPRDIRDALEGMSLRLSGALDLDPDEDVATMDDVEAVLAAEARQTNL